MHDTTPTDKSVGYFQSSAYADCQGLYLRSSNHGLIDYNRPMATYLDVETWARKDLFEFFIGFDIKLVL